MRKLLGILERGWAWFLLSCLLSACTPLASPTVTGPDTIPDRFIGAFVDADADEAREVTVETQWYRLDEEMKDRQPLGWDIGSWEGFGRTCPGYSTSADEWSFDCWYTCMNSDVVSCLSIQNIIVRRTEEGWQVHDWGKVELTTGDC